MMTKNIYVKGYGDGSSARRRAAQRRNILVGFLVLVGLAGLLWWGWGDRAEAPGPLVRHKIMQPVPAPKARVSDPNGFPASKESSELEMAMEAPASSSARTPSPKGEKPSGEKSRVSKPQVEPQSVGQTHSREESLDSRRVVIQVGAFRKAASAESLQQSLEEKGYDSYLDKRVLKGLGLLHRVRIRGYATMAEARKDMAQLRQEGLQCFALSLGAEADDDSGGVEN